MKRWDSAYTQKNYIFVPTQKIFERFYKFMVCFFSATCKLTLKMCFEKIKSVAHWQTTLQIRLQIRSKFLTLYHSGKELLNNLFPE